MAFLQSAFIESAGQLSPDGRWLAYTSDEAGGSDIYVRPFPSGVGVTKISNGRSVQPRWSADGRELFYLSGPAARPTLMRVPVTIAPPSGGAPPVFEPGTPEPLFDIRANSYHPVTGTNFYAVSADGQRFLVNHIDATEDPVVNVVTNWRDAFGVPEER